MTVSRIEPRRSRIFLLIACLLAGTGSWTGSRTALAARQSAPAPSGSATAAPAATDDEASQDHDAPQDRDRRARSLILSPLLPPRTLSLPALPRTGKDEDAAHEAEGAGNTRDAAQEARVPGGTETPATPEAERLAPPDPAAIGLDEPDPAAGLPIDLWAGSARPVVARLMAQLPVSGVAPAARERALRLLLLAAPPAAAVGATDPDDVDGGDDRDDGRSLLRIRFERLAAAGEADRLLALAERLPPGFEDARIAGHVVDAMLLVGRYDEACRLAEDESRRDGAARWLVALTLCRALAGDAAGVDFLLGVLSETAGEEADGSALPPPLPALATRLADEIEGIDPPTPAPSPDGYRNTRLTPALVALARLSRAPLPLAAVENAPPAMLPALLGEETLTPAARLAAAHAALRSAVVPPERVAAVYAAHRFADGERDALIAARLSLAQLEPVEDATKKDVTRRDAGEEDAAEEDAAPARAGTAFEEARIEAAFFQWVSEATRPVTVLDRAARALAAAPAGRAERLARLLSLPLAAVDPTEAFGARAAGAFDVFMLAGRPSTAWQWWMAGDAFAAGGSDVSGTAELVRALDRRLAIAAAGIGLAETGFDAQELHARLARGVRALTPEARARWLDVALVHLAALGMPEAPLRLRLAALARGAAEDGAVPAVRAALWARTMRAAVEGRRGETMLGALLLDAEAHGGGLPAAAGPAPLAPAAGAAAVAGLTRSGAQRTARRLAVRHLLTGLWRAERASGTPPFAAPTGDGRTATDGEGATPPSSPTDEGSADATPPS